MRRAYEVFTTSFSHLFDPGDFGLGLGGSLSVNDFIAHGDVLVEANKIWKWAGRSGSTYDSNLPDDKQYLHSERVVCLKGIKSETTTHDSWEVAGSSDDKGEYPNNLYEDDPASLVETSYRKYELSVTYDRYNETPRLWLRGYNQFGLPLTKDEMLEDVPETYVGKSVTVEKHPFTGYLTLTVHPCNQREIVNTEKENFSDKNVFVNLLRMWSSVFPCINVLEGF
ncbi:hypothetical protein MACJ_002261 [Theileria orientalis]|uniref:Autophagocytosis associated protein n=1 Tax=Theileria orientalis TaxID=68886 RepID=A0A976M5W3_THEOR|nr:hypothetical protein MACJ_002261 [Theileria orientalis]